MDTLAEWLRRRPAKPMGSPCVGSNPTGVVFRDQLCKHKDVDFIWNTGWVIMSSQQLIEVAPYGI